MKWFVSDVLDDGHWGIITEKEEIVIGAKSPLSEEQAKKIVAVHNRDIISVEQKEVGHKCPWSKATTCYLHYECNGCEKHGEECGLPIREQKECECKSPTRIADYGEHICGSCGLPIRDKGGKAEEWDRAIGESQAPLCPSVGEWGMKEKCPHGLETHLGCDRRGEKPQETAKIEECQHAFAKRIIICSDCNKVLGSPKLREVSQEDCNHTCSVCGRRITGCYNERF